MSQQTALDPTKTDDDFPTVNHYVKKWQITESIVTGKPVQALCGDRFVVNGKGGGQTSDRKAMVCPMCADVYGRMRP